MSQQMRKGRVDRLERLTDLVLVLLGSQRPLTQRELVEQVPGYPEEPEARRQAFERDKRILREQGIALATEAVDAPEQVGYRLRPEDYYLPDLDLDEDEQAALNLAVAAVGLGEGGDDARDALMRLGSAPAAGTRTVAELPALPALGLLHDAIRRRAEVTFGYRGEDRDVCPSAIRFHRGRWYLIGFDRGRDAARTFRVDRIESSPRAGADGSGALPDGFDDSEGMSVEPWRFGDAESVAVRLRVDARLAQVVAASLGSAGVIGQGGSGSVVVELQVTNLDALVSWVVGLGEHAVVESPDAARRMVVARLEELLP